MKKFFRILKRKVIYYNAVRLAEKCYAKSGYRYFVMADCDGKLIVADKKNLRILKRNHYIEDTPMPPTQTCVYYTANHAGKTMGKTAMLRRKHLYIYSR